MQTPIPVSVLIADDEPTIRNGLNAIIPWNLIPATVICLASDGAEALDCLSSTTPPDIAIVDIRMPKLNGLELISKARENGNKTEFLILSGYNDFTWAQQAIRYGVQDYILKPFKKDELVHILGNLAEKIRKNKSVTTIKTSEYELLEQSSKNIFLTQLVKNEFNDYKLQEKKFYELFPQLNTKNPFFIIVFLVRPDDRAETTKSTLQKTIQQKLKGLAATVFQYDPFHTVTLIREADFSAAAFANACIAEVTGQRSCRISAGIGTAAASMADCHISFENAVLALSYQLYDQQRTIYDSGVICNTAPPAAVTQIDTERIVDAICRNDIPAVHECTNSFFYSIFYTPMPPPGFVRGMCIFLIKDVQTKLIQRTGAAAETFPEIPYKKINELAAFSDIKTWITSLFLTYSNETIPNAANRQDHFIQKAKEYIDSHIEQRILAEDVAGEVNLSTSYFTIYFKAKTGSNFRDYILYAKCEHAKQLLVRHDISICMIAERLGYEDYRSFCRAFKKQTGCTPSDYQKQYDIRKKKQGAKAQK